jgi:osmotically-inducible protein OsmY
MTNPVTLIRPVLLVVLLAITTSMLQGCLGLAITGAATATGMVVADRRTTAQQADDKLIELKVNNQMRTRYGDSARINSMVYQGVVLLTGEALIEEIKVQAGDIARKVEKVKSVSNQIVVVQEISPFSVLTNDTWITSKVMATLATTKEIPSRTINVTTERSVVFLMGMVTQREGDLAAEATAQVSGVRRVEKLFQIISPAEANKLDSMAGTSNGTGTPLGESAPTGEGTVPKAPASSSGAVEVMPIQ